MKNPLTLLLRGLILFYRKAISPYRPPCCRYIPTCSSYALTALERFGPLRGGLLAAWRLLRCNPFSPGGFDPVPEHFTFRRQFSPPPRHRSKR